MHATCGPEGSFTACCCSESERCAGPSPGKVVWFLHRLMRMPARPPAVLRRVTMEATCEGSWTFAPESDEACQESRQQRGRE